MSSHEIDSLRVRSGYFVKVVNIKEGEQDILGQNKEPVKISILRRQTLYTLQNTSF